MISRTDQQVHRNVFQKRGVKFKNILKVITTIRYQMKALDNFT